MAPQELERQTLIEAVQQLVTSGATPLEVELRVTGEPLVGCHDDTAFRVIQEALTNARRHARAGRVTITLSWGGEALLVDVNDDGIGFDPLARTDGHGLRGMTDRVEQIGGRLVVESAAGAGSTISAVVPR